MDNQERYLRELSSFFWENNFSAEEFQLEKLASYAELVAEKNSIINLISRKDVNSVVENHVFISAYISKFIPEKCTNFIDIGTGGGFPGIPFGILRPALKGVLVDSIKKKTDSVAEFVKRLRLSNLTVENSRVESPEFIEKYGNRFDLVISRATVPLEVLLRYALPLIEEKAIIASLKGGDLTEEIYKAEVKYKTHIRKLTVFELNYKPTNVRNEKEKKLLLLELRK